MKFISNQILSQRIVQQLSATFFIGVLLTASSCQKEESSIGDTLQGDALNVITSDTFNLITYSEAYDSLETDETSVNLLGYYNDPVFGEVDAGFVTQIRLSSANPSLAADVADVVVDSVILGLAFNSINYYGSLTDPLSLEVYRISDELVREDQAYYEFENPTLEGGDLVLAGSAEITPDYVAQQIVGDDTLSAHLRIKLDPALIGQDLVDINGDGNMSTDEGFVSVFKGLYVKVNSGSLAGNQGGIWYFGLEQSLSKLTLFFHETSDPTSKEYAFNINSSAARYNKIDFDRTGTKIEDLLNDSSLGQEEFYTQGSGIWSVIEIPHIMSLYLDADGNEDRKIINKAELILPVQDFTSDYFDPSASLFLAKIIDEKTSDFTLDYSLSSTLSGNTVNYDQDNKEYRFLMTQELQAILNGSRENTGFRIYSPSFFGSTVERVIFNGPNSPLKDHARLEVTYTDY
jgi:hypothetical protein